MRIFLIRHGESEFNAMRIHQSSDTPLSQTGIRQAKSLAKRLEAVGVHTIFCSEYKRAMQTADYIQRATNAKITHTELLNEWRTPSELWGAKHGSDTSVRILLALAKHVNSVKWHYSDEENFCDLKKRVGRFLLQLSKMKRDGIVLVTHGGVIRIIIALAIFGDKLDGKTFHGFAEFLSVKNTGITELQIDEQGKWRLITFNDFTHLV